MQVPVNTYLKDFEQKLLANPMAALTWRIEIKNEQAQQPGGDLIDWPTKGVESQFRVFKEARERYFELVSQGDKTLVSVAHDHVATKNVLLIIGVRLLE